MRMPFSNRNIRKRFAVETYIELYQIRTVSSIEAEPMYLPLGEKATSYTGPLCPANRKGFSRKERFQTMTEQSFEAEASCFLRRISLYEINEFLHVRGERGGVDQIFVSSQRSLEIRVLSNVGLNGFSSY